MYVKKNDIIESPMITSEIKTIFQEIETAEQIPNI